MYFDVTRLLWICFSNPYFTSPRAPIITTGILLVKFFVSYCFVFVGKFFLSFRSPCEATLSEEER